MPSLAWAAGAVAAAVLVGTAGTQAAWTGQGVVPGTPIASAAVVPPTVTCDGSLVSWTPPDGATRYHVYVAGIDVSDQSRTTLDLASLNLSSLLGITLFVLGRGPVTVSAEYGIPSWTSAASSPINCLFS